MDLSNKATLCINALKTRGFMIATAESCTGGMIAAALTDIAGSSTVVDRGFVTYSNEAKSELLDVPPDLIDAYGAVSAPVAEKMALGAVQNAHARLAIAVTGIAGPGGGSDEKPVGLVYFALAVQVSSGDEDNTLISCHVEKKAFGNIGRSNVRDATVSHAFDMILNQLTGGRP